MTAIRCGLRDRVLASRAACPLGAIALGATLLATNARAGDEAAGGSGGPPEELRASCAPVGYPSEAVLRWAQGTTRLRYAVGADGRAQAIEVTSPSGSTPGHALLDEAAVAFLQGCRFDAAASKETGAREMTYTWRLADLGRDRWSRMRHDLPGEAPDVYPELAGLRGCGLPAWPADTRTKVKAEDLILVLRVDAHGAVQESTVLRSSGQRVIDDEVRKAARDCHFRPALRDGQPVAAATAMIYPWATGLPPRTLPPGRAVAPSPTPPAASAAATALAAASAPTAPISAAAPAPSPAVPQPPRPAAPAASAPQHSTTVVMRPTSPAPAPAAAPAPMPAPTPTTATPPLESNDELRAAPTATGGCALPDYPPESAEAQEAGVVTIHLWYAPSGALTRTTIVESSGFPRLDDAVRTAFGRCRYAQVFGTGRVVDQEIEYSFNLR